MRDIIKNIRILIIGLALSPGCSNNTTASTATPFTLTLSAPGYPNKSFSAYVYGGGALKGVVRSNTKTDVKGNLTVTAVAVNANNCATSGTITDDASSYSIHARLDGAGDSSFIYPTGCASDAGFLNTASLGYSYAGKGYWPLNLNYLDVTYKNTFSLSGTGVGTVTRLTYCSVVDSQIATPTINTSSIMGYAQGNVNFTAGSATLTTNYTVAGVYLAVYKYFCWIDANNNGSYGSGDLIATSTSTTISSWTTIP